MDTPTITYPAGGWTLAGGRLAPAVAHVSIGLGAGRPTATFVVDVASATVTEVRLAGAGVRARDLDALAGIKVDQVATDAVADALAFAEQVSGGAIVLGGRRTPKHQADARQRRDRLVSKYHPDVLRMVAEAYGRGGVEDVQLVIRSLGHGSGSRSNAYIYISKAREAGLIR